MALAGAGEQAEPRGRPLQLAVGINSGPNPSPGSRSLASGATPGAAAEVLEWLRTESLKRVKLHSENIYFYT